MTEPAPSTTAAARLAVASLAFAEPAEWWGAAMADWVATFEPISDATGLEVAADVELDHLRWRLVAPATVITRRAPVWFDHLGLDAGPVAIDEVAAVAGGRAGCWLDVSAEDLRSGWDVDVLPAVAPSAIWPVMPQTAATRALAAWCRTTEVATIQSVGVMAGGSGDCDITLLLPGSNIDAQLASALSLFDHLLVEHLADEALGVITVLGRPRLQARVALTPDGVASLGVGSVEPPNELVLRLCDAMDRGSDTTLAAFEGALGVTDRLVAEAVQAPAPTPRVRYALAE